jgi:hypothetical protein
MDNLDSSELDIRQGQQELGGAGKSKIDYSRYDPVPFKKTATLVNYFIINTAQFLNS